MLTEDTIRRALDILVGGALLTITSPLITISAIGVLLSMGRPILFTQERVGLGGRAFRVIKFRTMRPPNPEEDDIANDSDRLTRVGQLLRSTSLDELPTLFNVIKGDMGLVGPRPLLIRYLPRYSKRQSRRHEIKPGVTGWAQVNGRNTVSWKDKLEMDVWYVDNRSLLLDARILGMTLFKVLQRDCINEVGGGTMAEFMGTSAEVENDGAGEP